MIGAEHSVSMSAVRFKAKVLAGIIATLVGLLGIVQGLMLGGVIFNQPFISGGAGGLMPFVCGVVSTILFQSAFTPD